MNKKKASIDLVKMGLYILKRIWLVIICAAIGFGVMYWRSTKQPDTYTASGTMYITNNNPNLINYGYTNVSDMSASVQLVNIYSEALKQPTVTGRALTVEIEELNPDGSYVRDENGAVIKYTLSQRYEGISDATVAGSISMVSINETPFVRISCRTRNPAMSRDICRADLLVAPDGLTTVVGAGNAVVQTYPERLPGANARNDMRQGLTGALIGAAIGVAILAFFFLMNQRVEEPKELTENYTLPILAQVKRRPGKEENASEFLLDDKSEMDLVESYAKLRMNLLYTLVDKDKHTVLVTSAISGEGKSTITSNLAISIAMSGKKVIIVDADMRRACQSETFQYDPKSKGLSDVLLGSVELQSAVMKNVRDNLDILPAGTVPPNPSELLDSPAMHKLLATLEEHYDLVLLDAPPINIVSDPLALSSQVAGGVFVVRQHFSDHREIRRALNAAEMTNLNLLGFVFYGEKIRQGSYYSRKYYHYRGYHYYHKYDTRPRNDEDDEQHGNLSDNDMFPGQEARSSTQMWAGSPASLRSPISEHIEGTDSMMKPQVRLRRTDDDEEAQETGDGTAPSPDGNLSYRRRRSRI